MGTVRDDRFPPNVEIKCHRTKLKYGGSQIVAFVTTRFNNYTNRENRTQNKILYITLI